ncbi:MAG: dehydrogenase [Bacteroidales bacterium]|nr:dehydrogenase [Bacteroidales bacterium]MCI6103378.1 dehydrogenase [Bacteroidales bacterium]MCI7597497.1 dehydrogenase [Bacteroidales bacterium]MCI7652839.1 dehydrogenase [Bacteroidales bacterium]MDD7705628.1 dehydrogenase [Bacteroidales bacterium]
MADNFLERRQRDYEERKARWLQKKHHRPMAKHRMERPDDEAL